LNSSLLRQRERPLTQEAFDKLLSWLDADRDRAGEKYENIRLGLIRVFVGRGCFAAEDLADETIDRVIKKLDEIAGDYVGDPALFFYGVARNIYLESLKRKVVHYTSPSEDTSQDEDPRYRCLDRCLTRLDKNSREFIINFYQLEKRDKIDHRREMARQLEITVEALRMRAHRIRDRLHECIKKCLE
jgi:DNA-directed RNA polymerase specialized sigma24 family protein